MLGHSWLWDVSNDGSHLLIRSMEPSALWSVGALGGQPRYIAKVEDTWQYQWSPDGKHIAYCDGQGSLYVMGSDGEGVHKLVTVKGISDLAWSPDGGRIRFTSGDALREVSSKGANLHLLFPKWNGPAGQCCGRWTPDGDFFLFLAGGQSNGMPQVGGFEQIWALDERHRFLSMGSPDPVQLTSGPIHWELPIPSRDGKEIFARGTIPRGELVRFDVKSKTLQPFLGGVSAESVSYSRDRSHIAYVSYPEGILWRAKPDGTEKVQLTTPPLYPFGTSWSADGTQIAITAEKNSSQLGIYTVPAQGGQPVLVAPVEADWEGFDASWSPAGHRLLYDSDPDNSLRILDLDSRKETRVPGLDHVFSPRWSPDGRYIAAILLAGKDHYEIRLFDVQTQQWSTLLAHMEGLGIPAFSHDGRFLYLLNSYGGNWSVYRVPVAGGKPEPVADLSGTHLGGALGFSFGLDPDDNPLTLRNSGSGDIYALTLDRR